MKTMINTLRHRTYQLLESDTDKGWLGKLIDLFLVTLILANVVAFILESDSTILNQYRDYFVQLEAFSLVVFGLEYLLRLWCVASADTSVSPLKSRLRWIRSPMAIIDLIAILPAILQQFLAVDLRILRLLRLLRILKLSRYSQSLRMLMKVLARESGSLQAMVFILVVMIIVSASGIYLVESKIQPEHFGSIPKAMWWAVVTLTTVGYGDVTPVTTMGKVFGACITILGIGIAALPAGILASGFASELEEQRDALQEAFRNALTEQKIALNQPRQIAKVRRQVGINKELADAIVRDMRVEQTLLSKTTRKKPAHQNASQQQKTDQQQRPDQQQQVNQAINSTVNPTLNTSTAQIAQEPAQLSVTVRCPCCQHQHQVELSLQHLTMQTNAPKKPPDNSA